MHIAFFSKVTTQNRGVVSSGCAVPVNQDSCGTMPGGMDYFEEVLLDFSLNSLGVNPV